MAGKPALSEKELKALDMMIEEARARGIDPTKPFDSVDDVVDVIDAAAEIAQALAEIFGFEARKGDADAIRAMVKKIHEATAQLRTNVTLNDLIALRRRAGGDSY